MEVEFLITYIIIGFAALAILAGIALWIAIERKEHQLLNDKELPLPPPPLPPRKLPWTFYWLLALTVATVIMLAVQLVLGLSIKVLVLIADSTHGVADATYYGVAAFAEGLKFKFGQSTVNSTLSNNIDRASGIYSVVVIVTTTVAIVVEAIIELRKLAAVHVQRKMLKIRGDEPGLGTAMLIVACLGMAINVGLLAIHVYMNRTTEEECEQITAIPSRGKFQNKAKKLFNVLHANCMHQCSPRTNLNTYGVLIHMWADTARTALLVIIGVVLETGVAKHHAHLVDMICSLVVSAMVLMGSVVLIHKVFQTTDPSKDTESHDPTAQSYGAANSR